jgi:dihydropteroate synthase
MTEASQRQPVRAVRGPLSAPGWLALEHDYPAVMGILNVTPDSFSDGGKFLDPKRAIAQAERMIADGADIIDIGAESTRPYGGQLPVSADEEISRLRPVLKDIVALGTPVSIDTMKPLVARFALDAGASIVNDVWGLQHDTEMARLVAASSVPVVAMHNRETIDPAIDIMGDIADFFARTLAIADKAGIAREKIVLDPGIGFGKDAAQSMTALARLSELRSFGCPLLVGASRKRFIGSVIASEPHQRLGGSLAAHLLAARNGAAIIRAHDVAETVQALRVNAAIEGRR